MTLNPRSDCDQTGFVSTLRQNCCRPMDAKRQNHLTDGGKKSLRRKIVRRNKLRLTRRLRANREAFFLLLNRSLQDVSEGLFIDSAELLAQRRRNKKKKDYNNPT